MRHNVINATFCWINTQSKYGHEQRRRASIVQGGVSTALPAPIFSGHVPRDADHVDRDMLLDHVETRFDHLETSIRHLDAKLDRMASIINGTPVRI